MKKLELEYDYDTDDEQLRAAKSMLIRENVDAVKFYAGEGDPLLLVENLVYQDGRRPSKIWCRLFSNIKWLIVIN